ncbi:short-chain dehydrogenase [Sporosarcina thermotolerans]|uniref:Short-chain dehydrogenase n=1 Tax=Sporosarcina thermotolerans TaxID=633404 RepID=A0AAW9A6P2_9BACL|nr:short-chain dehydrogenase [Sporosarcina thermotolerans]MDW0115965.1 short-chain dehydrogenase [Sporosarcina thermotolerans]WHT46827.1 short-chain dehydrogenase [Sporosarcina thermotolerans]
MRNNHALIIGGTGMLAGVSLFLAKEGFLVSVIGRTAAKFERLKAESPSGTIFPIQVDYDSNTLFSKVEKAIAERGPFKLIVSWTPNYRALEQICEINEQATSFRLIHMKGSRRYFEDEEIRVPVNCEYEKVFLGFVKEEGTSRWLTHDEIAGGVVEHIVNKKDERIIGQLHPYSERPS